MAGEKFQQEFHVRRDLFHPRFSSLRAIANSASRFNTSSRARPISGLESTASCSPFLMRCAGWTKTFVTMQSHGVVKSRWWAVSYVIVPGTVRVSRSCRDTTSCS